jgi:Fe-S cluster assembly iron-binding protein IscA
MIKISKSAAARLKEMIAKEKNPQDTMLRVAFGGYG